MRSHTTQTEQVGVFPCRGWGAPCQRAPGSIEDRGRAVNAANVEGRAAPHAAPEALQSAANRSSPRLSTSSTDGSLPSRTSLIRRFTSLTPGTSPSPRRAHFGVTTPVTGRCGAVTRHAARPPAGGSACVRPGMTALVPIAAIGAAVIVAASRWCFHPRHANGALASRLPAASLRLRRGTGRSGAAYRPRAPARSRATVG